MSSEQFGVYKIESVCDFIPPFGSPPKQSFTKTTYLAKKGEKPSPGKEILADIYIPSCSMFSTVIEFDKKVTIPSKNGDVSGVTITELNEEELVKFEETLVAYGHKKKLDELMGKN